MIRRWWGKPRGSDICIQNVPRRIRLCNSSSTPPCLSPHRATLPGSRLGNEWRNSADSTELTVTFLGLPDSFMPFYWRWCPYVRTLSDTSGMVRFASLCQVRRGWGTSGEGPLRLWGRRVPQRRGSLPSLFLSFNITPLYTHLRNIEDRVLVVK
jgi:hypothetical protein